MENVVWKCFEEYSPIDLTGKGFQSTPQQLALGEFPSPIMSSLLIPNLISFLYFNHILEIYTTWPFA